MVGTGSGQISTNFPLDIQGGLTAYEGVAPADGQLLIGDAAGGKFDMATLTPQEEQSRLPTVRERLTLRRQVAEAEHPQVQTRRFSLTIAVLLVQAVISLSIPPHHN